MRMLKITAFDNGAHANQSYQGVLPEGWAIIPDGMQTPNFPFGEVTAAEIDGVMTVTDWTAGIIPETDPEKSAPTAAEQLRADVDYIAAMLGVEL